MSRVFRVFAFFLVRKVFFVFAFALVMVAPGQSFNGSLDWLVAQLRNRHRDWLTLLVCS